VTRNFVVRAADPSDAEALTRLARDVSAEPEAWLISTDGEWRSVGDERRYLKAVRRYPHAAVFVAERSDGAIVGRLSLARDTHPASAHVADLGLMVAQDERRQIQATAAANLEYRSAGSLCSRRQTNAIGRSLSWLTYVACPRHQKARSSDRSLANNTMRFLWERWLMYRCPTVLFSDVADWLSQWMSSGLMA